MSILNKSIDYLKFGNRTKNCLLSFLQYKYDSVGDFVRDVDGRCITEIKPITLIKDLVSKTEYELLRSPNLGRKSLNEIIQNLKNHGLHLGMKIDENSTLDTDELNQLLKIALEENKRKDEFIKTLQKNAEGATAGHYQLLNELMKRDQELIELRGVKYD